MPPHTDIYDSIALWIVHHVFMVIFHCSARSVRLSDSIVFPFRKPQKGVCSSFFKNEFVNFNNPLQRYTTLYIIMWLLSLRPSVHLSGRDNIPTLMLYMVYINTQHMQVGYEPNLHFQNVYFVLHHGYSQVS